ncbi:hypothetical protein D8B23_01250 [Verminephrobacter aporrectodeae subsp. tuberculatae]|nr:hypothetical protein [Verminephrobacter aporrectodeae subsp. tuberculatae]
MVLVYDKDWDFVAKVVVAATARIVTLHANPATSNDYWAQDGAGTWVNLSSARYDSKMMIEGGQLRLDIPTIHGGPFDAGRAAGHAPLSLVGQAPDLPHDDGFWF